MKLVWMNNWIGKRKWKSSTLKKNKIKIAKTNICWRTHLNIVWKCDPIKTNGMWSPFLWIMTFFFFSQILKIEQWFDDDANDPCKTDGNTLRSSISLKWSIIYTSPIYAHTHPILFPFTSIQVQNILWLKTKRQELLLHPLMKSI